MKTIRFTVGDPLGLHARPAGMLVKIAQGFESDSTLYLERTDMTAPLKRLLAVMGLAVKKDDTVLITVNGSDEEAAAQTIEAWLNEHLGSGK